MTLSAKICDQLEALANEDDQMGRGEYNFHGTARENTPYFVNETKSDFRPDFCHIMANDWELAE